MGKRGHQDEMETTMIKLVKDFADKNTTFVLRDMQPAGYITQFSPKEFKLFDADGNFINWFTSKRAAASAL